MALPGMDEVLAGMQRDINCLTDSDRSTRKRGLTKLIQKLFTDKDAPAPEILQEIYVRHILPMNCRLLGDPVEKCRELSIELLGKAAETLPDPTPIFAPLLPQMAMRIGTTPIQEDSEELRLQLVQLLGGALVQRGGAAGVGPVLGEAVAVLTHAYVDPFHEITKAASAATVQLLTALPAGALESHITSMLKALVQNLGHRHSAVRLQVLKALDAMVLGGPPDSVFVETVVPAVRPLVFDQTPSVRDAAIVTLAGWLRNARSAPQLSPDAANADTLLAFPTRLLPMLLLAVTDENGSLAEKALAAVEDAGECYAQRVREATVGAGEKSDDPMEVSVSVEGMAIDGDSEDPELGVPRAAPFTGRPKEGVRGLVKALLKRMLPPLLKDVREWTVAQRRHATRELYTLLAIAEGAAEEYADQLLPAVCAAVGDDEPDIAQRVVSASHMIGNFVAPRVWVPLLLDNLLHDKASSQQRSNTLVVLSALLLATHDTRLGDEELMRITAALASEDLRGSDHPGVRRQLHGCVANLVTSGGGRVKPYAKNMFLVLLQLKAQQEDPHLVEIVGKTMEDLATACGMERAEALYAMYAEELLQALAEEEAQWQSHSPGRFLLESLLRGCTAEVLGRHMGLLMPIVASCVGLERDPHIRLAMLHMLDEMFDDPARGPAFSADARSTVLQLLIAPAVWRAGKTAAAVRYQAVLAMSTFLERGLCPPEVLLACIEDTNAQVVPTITTAMEEDYYADTRRAGTYLMEQLLLVAGPGLDPEMRRSIYPNLLKRLDDSNDEIRIRAASCCKAFWTTTSARPYDDTNTEYFLNGMLVHMDDADPRVQEAMCVAMEAAAVAKPLVVMKVVQNARNRHRSAVYCDRVLMLAAETANK